MPTDSDNTIQFDLEAKLESWRERLLDLGNRNPLINCNFTERSNLIEFDTPSTETIWRTLAADSEAGASAMRFPWRRDLVPPPDDWQEFVEELDDANNDHVKTDNADATMTLSRRKRREWNPPIAECRQSPSLKPSDLLVDRTDSALDRKLRKLSGDAQLSMSEQGVHSLYAAFGFLKWYESVDSGEQRISPLILVPVSLSRETTSAPWVLTEAEDDALDNLCLRQRLRQDFKLELPPLPEISELEEPGAREKFLQEIRAAIVNNDRWEVEDRCSIGRFAFPKIAMWQDLGEHRNAVTGNSYCRILGGDEGNFGDEPFGPIGELPTAKDLDDVLAPGVVKTILDCDSSQLEAIAAARKGVSFVLDGPPGTGKSQTIANIIADSLSVGRTVLFVSEKIAALEVVKNRLEDRGLGDFCLECHSSKANRRAVLFEMERCLNLPAEVYKDSRPKLDELSGQREQLNRYARELHKPRKPLGFSPFELFGRISQLKANGVTSRTRCEIPDSAKTNRSNFDRTVRLLERAGDFADLLQDYDNHPWRGCRQTTRSLSLHDDLKYHLEVLADRCTRLGVLFEPLVSAKLLAPVTLANIAAMLQSCRVAITTPDMPRAWLEEPARSSKAIIKQIGAEVAMGVMNKSLAVFNCPADPSLPIDAVRALIASDRETDRMAKLPGLYFALPRTLSERRVEIERQLSRLAPSSESLARLQDFLQHWETKTKLKMSSEASCQNVNDFGKAIEMAACVGPGREAWFDSRVQPAIEALANKAIAIATKNGALADQISTVLPVGQILPLAERLQDALDKTERITQVAELGLKELRELDAAEQTLSLAVEQMSKLAQAQDEISRLLGLTDSDWHNQSQPSDSLPDAIERLERVGIVLGGFKEQESRTAFRKICEEAINDLGDAESIRSGLSKRLSHRAFRESSAPVVAKGTAYVSLWKRWFGGYSKYRMELAEFYIGEVPKGSELLDDVVMLERYHRRLLDAQSAAAYWSDRLPDDFDALQASGWASLTEALDALEQFQKAWPTLVERLPDAPISIAATTLAVHMETYIDCRQKLQALSIQSQGEDASSLELQSVGELLAQIERQRDRVVVTSQAWRTCEQFTLRPLQSIQELVGLLKALLVYCQRATNLNEGSQKYADWFPRKAQPTRRESWEAMRSGVAIAKQFTAIGVDSRQLVSIWCVDRFQDTQELWAKSGADMQRFQQELSTTMIDASIQAEGVSFSDVSKLFGDHFASLSTQLEHTKAIAASFSEECNPSFDELDGLADQVLRYRQCQEASHAANSELKSLEIESIDQSDLKAAQWLESAVTSDRLTELSKAVATSNEVRLQVQAVVEVGVPSVDLDYQAAVQFLETLFHVDQPISGNTTISNLTMEALGHRCRWWTDRADSFDQWVAFAGWCKDVSEAGFAKIINELIQRLYPPGQTSHVVAMQVYRELFDELAESDRHFGEFDIDQHERVRERFRQLDQWEVQAAATQIRQYQLGRSDRPSSSFAGADSSELGILQKEIAKKRKHKPLRRLFAEIPTILQRLKPCVMMSPLSVSTFLNCDDIRFDLVIFDEASQVFPWDALGAIYRGTQLIVAGDEKQLPPTNFFSRQDAESDDEEDDIGDYESILSLCKSVGMPNKRLKWHYRSKREPLIAFSNRHFYGGELVTFPSVDDGDGVRFEYVPDGRWIDRKNLQEAERVVQMIVDHIRTHPEKSLGVIALNSTHQRAIEDALYDLRRDRPDIDALFHGSDSFGTTEESLFIKNLENVQGDERDFIFLSLGYGFNNLGKFNKNFGPINKQHGERRLNVAITRARESLTFVASVRSSDMDLSGSKSEGAHLLKSYLSYAERGVDMLDLAMQEIAGDVDSPFEEEVAAALIRRGLQPVSQVGCGGFRIDLALKHPDRPGQFCLAIECDGATYHSSHTARDRDRIRQSILESLGWKIVRIWSTDWVRNSDRQVERVLQAYEEAIISPQQRTLLTPEMDERESIDESLEPTFVRKDSDQSHRSKLSFDSIDEVPDETIQLAATYLLTQAGAMTMDDLVRQTSRELGFSRTGPKIRARIETRLLVDLEAGKIKRSGQKVAMT